MHRQTKYTQIPMDVKLKVWERDHHRCVLCGNSYQAAPNAHYIARSHGGLGIEQNIVTLCMRCHCAYDNSDQRSELRDRLRGYLKTKYENWNEENLIYTKGYEYAED